MVPSFDPVEQYSTKFHRLDGYIIHKDFQKSPLLVTKQARLAQSVERQTLNLVVVGSSPTVGDHFFFFSLL